MRRPRWLFCPIACLSFGVVTTLALAWAAPLLVAMSTPSPAGAPTRTWSADTFWISDRYAGHYFTSHQPFESSVRMLHIIFEGTPQSKSYYNRNPPPAWSHKLLHSMRGEGLASHKEWWGVETIATGWPLRCFRGADYEPFQETSSVPSFSIIPDGKGGITTSPSNTNQHLEVGLVRFGGPKRDLYTLPVEPLPRGLILNTLFFAAAWWLMLFAFAALRRRIRSARGRCISCGYPRKGLAPNSPCPECGTTSSHTPAPTSPPSTPAAFPAWHEPLFCTVLVAPSYSRT